MLSSLISDNYLNFWYLLLYLIQSTELFGNEKRNHIYFEKKLYFLIFYIST